MVPQYPFMTKNKAILARIVIYRVVNGSIGRDLSRRVRLRALFDRIEFRNAVDNHILLLLYNMSSRDIYLI